MINKLRKILFLLALIVPVSFASNNSLAILDIMVSVHDDVELTVHETQYLTDELRRQAILILPNTTSVFTRDSIISNLSKSKENISTAIDAGKAMGAEYVVSGVVGNFQGLFSLTVELYDVRTGKMLGTFVTESENARGLLGTIREKAPSLFGIIPKTEPAAPDYTAQYVEEPEAEEKPKAEAKPKEPEAKKPVVITTVVEKPKPKEEAPKKIEAMPATAKSQKSKVPFYVALGLDIIGAAVLGFGIYKEVEAVQIRNDNKLSEYKGKVTPENEAAYRKKYDDELKRANDARSTGNIALIAGGVLLAGGVAVHIWF